MSGLLGKVGTEAWTWDAFIRQMVEEYRKQEEMEEEMGLNRRDEDDGWVAPCKEPAKPMDWEESEDLRRRTSTQRWQGTEMGC